jgi:hypothetical protein
MKNKTLLTVAAITLVLIVLTISLVSEKKQARLEKDVSGQVFLPLLRKDINAVAMLELEQQGSAITLVRDGDNWSVKESGGYPADFTKIRQTLIVLSDLKTIEPKTRKPENFEQLGVKGPDGVNITKQVTVKDADGKMLASLIIGNAEPGGGMGKGSLYVRKSDDDQVWLVEGRISLPNRPVDWLEKSIIDIKQADVKRVTINRPGNKKPLVIEKESRDDKEFKVKGLDKDKSPKPGMLNNITSALSKLDLEDVMAREGFDFDNKNAVMSRFETFDDLTVTASIMEKDGKNYALFEAAADENVADQKPAEENTQENFNVVGDAIQQAATLNQKLQSWVYVIPEFKANYLKTKREDVID